MAEIKLYQDQVKLSEMIRLLVNMLKKCKVNDIKNMILKLLNIKLVIGLLKRETMITVINKKESCEN